MKTQTFNNPNCFIEGWYWALPSASLKIGRIKAITVLGRNLAIYRDFEGRITALDAYCPHMGAHFAEGKVEGTGIRCFFHNWKFDSQGKCVEVPCLEKPLPLRIKTWPAAEKYGLIWVWTGDSPQQPPPFVPELEGVECDSTIAARFLKNCHPNVVAINAIDAHHFNTVHDFPFDIVFEGAELNNNAITFKNITRGGEKSYFVKLIRPLYKNEIAYKMCYWYGSVGTVTIGPDLFHFHILFALRLVEGGKTEGQTVLITPKRTGLPGFFFNRLVLEITKWVGNYFAKGDTQIFQTIRFNLQTPVPADRAIVQFIQHVEGQKTRAFGTWEPTKESC